MNEHKTTIPYVPGSPLIKAPDGYEFEMRVTEVTTGKYLRSRIGGMREGEPDLFVYQHLLQLLQAGHTGNISDVKTEDKK